jgi:hypothetical protein
MRKFLLFFIKSIRNIKSKWFTFLFKHMLHSYGSVGVNGMSKISTTAIVDVGDFVSFNGVTITGWGG